MRHRSKVKKLGRLTHHRHSMIRNLSTSLALHGKVKTTATKAKALRSYFERLISTVRKADSDQLAIRVLRARLFTEDAQRKMLSSVRGKDKKDGKVHLTHIGIRPGDRAEVVLVEY